MAACSLQCRNLFEKWVSVKAKSKIAAWSVRALVHMQFAPGFPQCCARLGRSPERFGASMFLASPGLRDASSDSQQVHLAAVSIWRRAKTYAFITPRCECPAERK